jgi:orotate phosphoribosyltransferase
MYSGMRRDVARLIEIFHNETGAIQYGNYVFASGRKSNNKIDAEFVLKNEEGAEIIGKLVGSKILDLEKRNRKKYEIAGVANGGAKVAGLAAGVLGREYVSLNHKTGKVTGEICPVEHIICEDVTTLGSSIRKCCEKFILPRKAFAKHSITVVDRDEGAVKILAKLGIKHKYFITKQQLGIYEDSF